ncbi:MAG: hypothetical protein H6719_07025 [Sandaracinaceae bacterium]|nr:hypothetical protein [Sandaracinaceae bacterium]
MDLAEAAELPDLEDERREDLIRVLARIAMSALSDDDGHEVRLELALLHAEAGRVAEAIELIREAHRSRPTLATARVWHELALRSADPEQAARALEAELQHASSDGARAALEIARGRAAEDEGDAEGALRAFTRASAYGVRIEAAWAAERVAAGMGRWKEAGDAAEQAARLTSHPDAAAEWAGRAARYRLLDGERDAAAALLRNSGAGLDAPSVWLGWEMLAAGADDASAWIDLRRTQLEASPSADTAIDAALVARYRLADEGLARAFFERALESSTGDARRFVLAELCALLDPIDDLELWLEYSGQRLEIEPDAATRAHLAYRLARATADLAGDPAGARAHALTALNDDPLHGPALELAARLEGEPEEDVVAPRLRAEAEAAPTEAWRADALLALADRLGETAGVDAIVDADRALPADLGIFASLERPLARRADHEALAALRERVVPQVQDPVAKNRLLLGIARGCVEHLDEPERARATLRDACQIEGTLSLAVEARRRLAEILEGDARVEALRKLVALDPADASRHRADLAELLVAASDEAGALDVVREGYSSAPLRHPLRRTAQRLFVRLERSRELLALYDETAAASEGVTRVRWLQRAADVCDWELDQPEEAMTRLRAALEIAPGSGSVGAALRDLLARALRFEELLALDSRDDDPIAVLRRAATLEAVGDEAKAATEYARAVDLGLGFARPALERLLLRRGRWKDLVERWGQPPEDTTPERALQLRYRAGAVAAERLGDPTRALTQLGEALAAKPAAISAILLRLRILGVKDPARVGALDAAIDPIDDPALRRGAQRELAHLIDDREESLALWRAIGLADPKDVVAAVHTTVGLERAGRTREQQEWAQSTEQPSDAGLETLEMIRSARRSTTLGALRAAVDTWETALVRPQRPFLAHFELPRLYLLLDQPELHEQSLTRLTQRLPRGPLAARTSMVLAEALQSRGDEEGAMRQLERASIADPTYYPALAAIEVACEGTSEVPLIDALLRAFESETRPEVLPHVGVHLGRLLVEADRVELAREVLERVVSIDHTHLPGQLWLAEVYEQTGELDRLYDVLEAAAESQDADPDLVVRALSRRVDIALAEADDLERVSAAVAALGAVSPDHPKALEATLTVALAKGDHLQAAAVLEKLIELPDLKETVRVGYLFELSTIKADKLGDVAAAIRALAEIRSPEAKEEAVRRLVELGDRSGRWDIASQALEAALDEADQLERSWELTIRKRLAALFAGPLDDGEAAVRQLRRIVELDPTDVDALETLAAGADDPAETTRVLRLLFAARPTDHALLERLRSVSLDIGDEDSAFTAEAVAVGVGAASEEVEYFYKQRRTTLGSGAASRALAPDELSSFLPEGLAPAIAFMKAIEPVLPEVFPPDFSAYGIDPSSPPTLDAGFVGVIEAVAALYGVTAPATFVVAAQRGPAIEHHAGAPMFLVPRPLLDAPRREQRFVLGALCFRLATGTSWADPCRADALRPNYLAYIVAAAGEVLDGVETPSGSRIQDDLRARIDLSMGNALRDAAEAARTGLDPTALDHEALLRATDLAATRAGLLTSRDPAAALTALSRWKRLVREEDDPVRALAGFAVSERHRELRASLGLGLVQ